MELESLINNKNVSVTVGMGDLVGFFNHIKANYVEVSEVRERLVNINGVCAIMDVCKSTINNWRNTGYLKPAVMKGNIPYYRIGDLLDRGGKLPKDILSVPTFTEESVNHKS